jgi:glycosyltransferase involved in cell wall biosynthesis
MRKDAKKICYISYRKTPSPVIENFSQAVFDSGYDVTVITIRNHGEPSFEIDNGRKIYRISISDSYPATNRRNGLRFISKVIPILNRNRFSIIHMTTNCPYFIFLKLFTFSYAKSILHILTYPLASARIRSLKYMLTISLQCYFMDKIIVQSEELKKNWIGIRKLKKAVVIPVGFNKNKFYPIDPIQRLKLRIELGLQENQPVLVYSGAIAKLRKIDKLIEAFKDVLKIHKDVKLLMIGDGNSFFSIQTRVQKMNLEKSIIFTGRIPYAEVSNFISVADIGISYVPINNNFNSSPPLKTFEYLACGIPTIATKTESNSKIIRHGFNGILVNDTPDDVANAIINLLGDKDLQRHLSQHARNSIMEFDFDYITQKYLIPLYKELL